jgi:uncharacterized SAM-binding protein YcdF (DUF218 family)
MTTPLTDRERFVAALFDGPLYPTEAIVVAMGQDARPRLATAAQLLLGTPGNIPSPAIVLTGGVDDVEGGIVGAERGAGMLMGIGVAPDRILVEPTAQHTREQAVQAIDLLLRNAWQSFTLIASGYHLPRCFLTFLMVLMEQEAHRTVRMLPMGTAQAPWFGQPEGCGDSRMDLYAQEVDKVERYRALGHVASYSAGLAYLRHWEQAGVPAPKVARG